MFSTRAVDQEGSFCNIFPATWNILLLQSEILEVLHKNESMALST